MANPFLNDEALKKASTAGWAAPEPSTRATPIDDGPISAWESRPMTVAGTISATGVLFILLLAAAAVGWSSVESTSTGFPPLAFAGVAVGFGCVIALYFRPQWAKVLAPVYALGQGF